MIQKMCLFSSFVWMEPRQGGVTCEVCLDTLPCMLGYLTFGGIDGHTTRDGSTGIATTNVFSLDQPGQVIISKSTYCDSSQLTLLR